MSVFPALDDTEKSPGHGWSASNRFIMDAQTTEKQFENQGSSTNIYHHLINQNNSGEVPDALAEEEIINENEAQKDMSFSQSQQQQHALHHQNHQQQQHNQQQQQQHNQHQQQQHNQQLQQQPNQQQQHNQQQQQHNQQQQQHNQEQNQHQQEHLSHHQQLYQQQQHLQQKQAMLQKQVVIQQSPNRKQPQQNVLYTVLHQSGTKQQQQMVSPQTNRPIRHPGEQLMGRNVHQQHSQSRSLAQQQVVLNSNNVQNDDEINMQLLRTQQEIEENNKKLAFYGLPPVSTVNTPQPQSEYNSQQQQVLNNCDYVGSMRMSGSGNQSDPGSRIRQILTHSQTGHPQRKVDINFPDSNGAYQSNPRMPPSMPVQQKTPVITVSGQRPNILSHTQQRPHMKPGIVQLPGQAMQGINRTTSAPHQSPVQVPAVSTNQNKLAKTGMQQINKNNVVLEGGGQFEDGQAYVIRDRFGNARTMVWRNGEFHPFDKEKGVVIQHSTIDSSQRGRGARGRGRGRGRGQFHGNATSVHMTQSVRGGTPTINNGLRPIRQATPTPTIRPSPVNYIRQSLLHNPGHPNNHPIGNLSAQGHVIHSTLGSPSMPVISVVTTPCAPGQIVQQRPKLLLQNLMPAQQIKAKAAEDTCSTAITELESVPEQVEPKAVDSSIAEDVLDPPNIPDDPSAYAVCQYCGTTSMDKYKCESCKRMFTSATKYVIPGKTTDGIPETKRRKLSNENSITVTAGLDKNTFYSKKFQEQGEVYLKVFNTPNNTTMSIPGPRNNLRIIRPAYSGRGGRRGRGRGRGMAVPETVTISSDEEECSDINMSGTMSAPATPASLPSRSPSHAGEQTDCPESPLIPNIPLSLKRIEKTRVKKMEDAEGTNSCEKSPAPTEVTLMARTVRVGTFRGAPVEPLLISDNGLNFFIEGVTGTHKFNLYPHEIQQCLVKFDSDPNLIFFLTTHSCAVRTRKDLGMAVHLDHTKPPPEPYFDPACTEMRYQMITIVMDQLSVESRLEFQKYMELFKSWGKQGDEAFFMELSSAEADEIFRQSTIVQNVTQVLATSLVADHGYSQATEDDRQSDRSPSPTIGFVGPIIKLLAYPPPPARGGISITNEDLYCLQEGEFLNDVIIDFYLKYLLRERLSQIDHDRTHIFSSFFYKRLTQRIRGAAIDDDPNVTLPVKRHARVKTWTRKLDLFKKDFIVIPINEHAHWFLAIICFPGLEKPVENQYIPKPVTTPLIESMNVPTPPQPTDDGADEIEAEENEEPLPDIAPDKTEMENSDNTSKENGTTKEVADKEPTDSHASTAETENQSDENDPKKSDKNESQSEETESETEKPEGQSDETEGQSDETEGQSKKQAPEDIGEQSENNTAETAGKTKSFKSSVMLKGARGKMVEEGEAVPTEAVTGIKQPCIIVFDSLTGPSRARIITVLKEYLQVEWSVKNGGPELNKASIKGCIPKVPQQNNFSDCGVFMLQYVESFFEDPIQDFSTPMKGLHDWFSNPGIDKKREELRDLIIGLKEKYESNAGGNT